MTSKKGFVFSRKDSTCATKIDAVTPAWYYNWNYAATDDLKGKIPFIPMVWSATTARKNDVMKILAKDKDTSLLCFNEPDRTDQANMTPQQALELWPKLVETGKRLGSPATAANPTRENGWFDEFMKANPKVDFIAIHWYAAPKSASLLNIIDTLYNRYKLPIWITEFAVADWKTPNKYSMDEVAEFMKAIVPELEKRDYVERYCWKTRTLNDPWMGSSSLFETDGTLTSLGELYKSII